MTDNKELLIDVAQRAFARYGFRKTTLDDIAVQLGKGKTFIYYYFQGKEDVYKAVLDREVDNFIKELEESVRYSLSPEQKLKAYVETRFKTMNNYKVFLEAMNNENLSSKEAVVSCARGFDIAKIVLLKSILDDGVDNQIFKINNTEMASLAIETSLKGLETFFMKGVEPDEMQLQIDNLLNLLFYGVLKN
jgi:AcrR family transcriptional regulator